MSDTTYLQSNSMPTLKEIVENQERRKTVINYATEVFENAEIAEDWLNSPNFALGDKVPYDLLNTDDGIEQVRNLLGRIEYGVYS